MHRTGRLGNDTQAWVSHCCPTSESIKGSAAATGSVEAFIYSGQVRSALRLRARPVHIRPTELVFDGIPDLPPGRPSRIDYPTSTPSRMNRRSAQTEWVPLQILWGRAMRATGPSARWRASRIRHSERPRTSSMVKVTR